MEEKFASVPPAWKCETKNCGKDADPKVFCPTCRTNAYCTNECRLKDWDSKHWKKCKDTAADTAEFFALLQNPKDRKKLYKMFKIDSEKNATVKNIPKDFHLECRNENMDSPLCVAVTLNDATLVELLLRLGSGINHKGAGGNTPLHYAAMKGYGSLVKLLLNNGSDISITNAKGDTPVHVACAHGQQFALIGLLAGKADVHATNNDGKNPLYVAASHKHFHLVGLLLDHEQAFRNSPTLLFDVIRSGDEDFAQILIENGMSIEIKSDKGLSPLEEAQAANLKGLVKFFDDKKDREKLSVELKQQHEQEEREAEEKKREAEAKKQKEEEEKKEAEEKKKKEEEERLAEIERAKQQFIEQQQKELESLTSNLVSTSTPKMENNNVSSDDELFEAVTPLQKSLNSILEFRAARRLLTFMTPAYDNMKKAKPSESAVILQSIKETATQTAQAVSLCKNAIDSTFDEIIMMHCRTIMGNLTFVSANLKDCAKSYMGAGSEEAKAEEAAKCSGFVLELINIIKTIPKIEDISNSSEFPPVPSAF